MENKGLRKTKDFTPGNCPVVYCMNIIGGKWKPSIIPYVESYNIYRNGSLIGNVSKNSILEYQDHKRNRYYLDVYKVYSVSKKGREIGYSEVSLK